VCTKIRNTHLQIITELLILEDQSGFRMGRSCADNVFTMSQIIEKRREFNMKKRIGLLIWKKLLISGGY
jgi:hypothetical protein